MEISLLQILGIIAILLILPLGIYNNIRMKKKKQEMENYYNNNSTSENEGEYGLSSVSESGISAQEEAGRAYILQYKGSYSRESIKSALVGTGYLESDVEDWLNKYF